MAALWTFLRGLFAIFLGAILFFQPDKGLPLLTTFMGGFWIGSGLLSVRWGMGKEHSKLLTIVVGAIGILAGAIAISSRFITPWVSHAILNVALGIIMIITGVFHISGRMSVKHAELHRSRSGTLLGIFEIILGLILILADTIGPVIYTLTLIWAIFGGIALMADALQMRRESKSA